MISYSGDFIKILWWDDAESPHIKVLDNTALRGERKLIFIICPLPTGLTVDSISYRTLATTKGIGTDGTTWTDITSNVLTYYTYTPDDIEAELFNALGEEAGISAWCQNFSDQSKIPLKPIDQWLAWVIYDTTGSFEPIPCVPDYQNGTDLRITLADEGWNIGLTCNK